MADLVRVRVGDLEFTVGRRHAIAEGLTVLADEPTHTRGGSLRGPTRKGRPALPKVSVAQKAAEKKAALSADTTDNTEPSKKEN